MAGLTAELDRDYRGYRFYVEPLDKGIDDAMRLWRSHWAEQKEDELRGLPFNPAVDLFCAEQAAGAFYYITVRAGDDLVGHFGLSVGINKQTSLKCAGDAFFYIVPEHRQGLLGVKLIKFARDLSLKVIGCSEFSVSYRVTVQDLDPVLRRCGMKKIATVYTVRS